MGQNVSQPRRGHEAASSSSPQRPDRRQRRHTSFGTLIRNFDSPPSHSDAGEDAGGLLHDTSDATVRTTRSDIRNRLSRIISPTSPNTTSLDTAVIPSPHRSALHRSRSTFTSIFRRETSQESRSHGTPQRRASYMRAAGRDGEEPEFPAPRLPSIDQSSIFERDMFSAAGDNQSNSSGPSRRGGRFNIRRSDRALNRWHPAGERGLQRLLLRRRRSPPPSHRPGGADDQAVLLSQLLSAAAAATAATLMGDDHQALNEARSLSVGTGIGELGSNGEDGSFDGFLRALQNGRIASALRQSGEAVEGTDMTSNTGPLNFFRMFRFGSSTTSAPLAGGFEAPAADGRMVPIIIVGIRSISPSSGGTSAPAEDLPPFLDALTSFASPTQEAEDLALGHNSIDSILRPPHNGTSFRHRRRASMGGLSMGRSRTNDRYDDQRSPRRERPWSIASSLSEPRPPPATPASPSPELSRIPSRNSTPSHSRPASLIANSLTGESRRNSILHRSASSPLAIHTEESVSVHSTHSSDNLIQQTGEGRWDNPLRRSDTPSHIHYPRFASGHPRRNGVVEPDSLPPFRRPSTSTADGSSRDNSDARNDSRSWIIYVLGGSYPENHPILTTPSLFSDNPTYEDMMLLSALLGPAKAPVATEEDVENAGGVYTVILTTEPIATQESTAQDGKLSGLVAVATEDTDMNRNPARVALETEHRCLVCLCDFEVEETLRRLGKCGHLFHKECVDHWLTQGRNSCPLCRGEGVEEKAKAEASPEESDAAAAAV